MSCTVLSSRSPNSISLLRSQSSAPANDLALISSPNCGLGISMPVIFMKDSRVASSMFSRSMLSFARSQSSASPIAAALLSSGDRGPFLGPFPTTVISRLYGSSRPPVPVLPFLSQFRASAIAAALESFMSIPAPEPISGRFAGSKEATFPRLLPAAVFPFSQLRASVIAMAFLSSSVIGPFRTPSLA